MSDLFLERTFDPPLDKTDVVAMAEQSAWCFETYRVDWHGSLLATDGRRMLCWFSAADAQSVRHALRRAEADLARLWSGTVHDAHEGHEANVIVERSFDLPVALEAIQAIEDRNRWCLDTHNVRFVRTFFSTDRKRMLCLYSAPDAESVRAAQRDAAMPVDRVWAFEPIRISDLR